MRPNGGTKPPAGSFRLLGALIKLARRHMAQKSVCGVGRVRGGETGLSHFGRLYQGRRRTHGYIVLLLCKARAGKSSSRASSLAVV